MNFFQMLRGMTGAGQSDEQKETTVSNYENDPSHNAGIFAGLKYNSYKLLLSYIDSQMSVLKENDENEFNRGQISAYTDIRGRISGSIDFINEWLKNNPL